MSGRNNALTSLAGKLRARGKDESEILRELLIAPEREGLPESDCRTIARSIGSKSAGKVIEKPRDGWADSLHELAARRGWSVDALQSFAVADGREVHFLMRDAKGTVIGKRRRRGDNTPFANGAKAISQKGGKNGILGPWPIPQDDPVLIVEGEADLGAALSAGWSSAIAKPGSKPGRAVEAYLQTVLANREVVLAPDPDEVGREGANNTASALVNAGCRVRVIPPLPNEDLDKRLQRVPENERAAALTGLVEAAVEWKPREAAPMSEDSRTRVVVGTDEARVNDEALAVLQTKDPDIYARGDRLVTVAPSDLVSSARIIAIPEGALRERLARFCRFVAIGEKGPAPVHVPAFTPKALTQRYSWPGIRPLAGITEAPMLTPDGTLHDQPGYHPNTGFLYIKTHDWPEINRTPSLDEAIAARDRLLELVADFPFDNESGRATWLAALLSVVGRSAIEGPVPMFIFDANTRGTGKTMLLDIASIIGIGRVPTPTPYSAEEEEMRKKISTLVIEGKPVVKFDNAGVPVGCDSLDIVLTSTTWSDRRLGSLMSIGDLPIRCVWLLSGNNVVVKGDTVRRVLWCRLESPEEHPEQRTDFRIPNLVQYVGKRRTELFVDAMTILMGYIAAGRPPQDVRPFGSFEAWAGLIANAVAWIGMGDVIAARIEIAEKSDRDRDFLEGVIEGLERHNRQTLGATSGELIRLAERESGEDLHDLFAEYLGERNGAQRLGKRLQLLRGRVVNGRRLSSKVNRGAVKWIVDRIKPPTNPGPRGESGHTMSVVGVGGVGGSQTPCSDSIRARAPAHTRAHGAESGTPTNSNHSHHSAENGALAGYEIEERLAIQAESATTDA
jgi:hypothetical protein